MQSGENLFKMVLVSRSLFGMHPGHGMEWNRKWNGTEISLWNMEDARMEWKI